MNRWNSRISSIKFWLLEEIGLNWVFVIFFKKEFPLADRPDTARQTEIRNLSANLQGDELSIVVEKYEELLADEDKQRVQIESKAFSLLGITSVASGFIIGFAQFLLNSSSSTALFLQWVVVFLYALIGFSLVMIILLAWRAVIPGKEYVFMSPEPSDLMNLTSQNKEELFKERASDLLISYENNQAISVDKATYVRGAQDWFRNTIVLLLLLLFPLTIASTPLLNNNNNDSLPIEVIVLTPTNTPTKTPLPTFTPVATLPPTPTQISTSPLIPISLPSTPISIFAPSNRPTSFHLLQTGWE